MGTLIDRGLTLVIDREYTEVNPNQEPDPDWLHVDAAGHRHRWISDGLPTVEEVPVGIEWSDCLEEYVTSTELRCRRCGEPVRPGYRTPRSATYIRGLTTASGRMAAGHPDFERLEATLYEGAWVRLEINGGDVRFEALATNVVLGGEILFVARNVQIPPGEEGAAS